MAAEDDTADNNEGNDGETAEDPAQWGIAVLGPNTKVADEEIVPAKTMLDKTHQGVEA